ncbi:hemicentin-1-like [Alosa pseudoharengus]|uniref:hemicentin-1-like n=1 Tax=Alosa pseudoharengus TaxID=34774 RepID=UPI003F8CCDA4
MRNGLDGLNGTHSDEEPVYREAKNYGLEVHDPWEVVYTEVKKSGVVEKEVILECGPSLPDVYIWGFTKPGTETLRAVVYNFGRGPKIQRLTRSLGELSVNDSSASISIAKLPLAAQGLYTCQALYDTAQGARLYYYYIYLRVLVPVTRPSVVPSDSSPAEGSSTRMRCGLENGTEPIDYIWQHENKEGAISVLAQSNNSVLDLAYVTRNHTGWYRCLARNEVNQVLSERFWLDVFFGPDLPRIDIRPYSVTEKGYSVLERETVSLTCQASSHPLSQYVWLYNSSQVDSGPMLSLPSISRGQTGLYTCLSKNKYINTSSEKTVSLLVYYPPDGSPSCTVRPTNNYTDLTLWCSWEGGYPHASLHWSPFLPGANGQGYANATLTHRGPGTANNSVFECHGSHVALKTSRSCRISTWYPPGEAQCSAMATQNNEKLVLTCSWEGGLPRALLWWLSSSGDTLGKSEESSNTLVLPPSAAHSGQSFVCHAKHPLLAQQKSCVLKLEAPVLETQRSTVSVYEGGDVEITCTARDNYFPSNITWYNHLKQHVIESPSKYVLKHAGGWTNLTVKATDSQTDSGKYWCSATNAVGETEIPIHLLVNRHPVPPNVTISKIIFSGHGRTEANLNWDTTAQGEITEFIIERRQLPLSSGKTKTEPPWQEVASKLAPGTRSYKMRGLDPTRLYAVRIRAVNHLTLGNPSEEKVPEAVPVTKPSIVLSHSSPAEGSSIWIRCDLENGTEPISYLWEQESKEGTTSILAQGTNNNLVNVTMVTRNHAGWHRCIVGNEVSQEQSKRISLNVVFGPDVPHIEVTPRSVTEQGYSALEKETVSLVCQASSNPPSQYVWFYNNSQVHAGQMLTVRNIPRTSSGHYTCLAQNTNLNTRSKKSITLTVYYPPDGTPLCTILPTNNYTDLTLWCSWEGGYPHALLRWSPFLQGMSRQGYANVSFIQRGPATANNSVFVCHGSHVALNVSTSCSTRTWHPPGEPQCYAYATRNNEYLMFSCSWEGGFPRALLWWASSMGEAQGKSEENSNILVLHSSATYSGKSFVCHAQHPLFSERKQCVLKLEAPVLVTQRSMVSVYEGSDVQLTCILKANYPATEITWYNNLKQHVIETPSKYVLQHAAAWSNLTVRETDGLRDSGQYWCSATNAVGGTEIPIHLLVKRYPMPPNVTISKLVYSSRQRTEVDMEWFLKTQGDITGFIIERRRLPQSAGKRDADPQWQEVAVNLDPSTQTYKMSGFDPTGLYAVRLMAVNHRTIGHPSDVKSPADPPFTAYSAVIGAAIGGMIIAVVVIVLLFIYIMRNRNNNPRLHELLFGTNSLSRENINFPEDEISGRAEDISREHIPGGTIIQ